jgi:hypothetical protein
MTQSFSRDALDESGGYCVQTAARKKPGPTQTAFEAADTPSGARLSRAFGQPVMEPGAASGSESVVAKR